MMDCKHEQHMLIGNANGILCRGCGRLFKDFSQIYGEAAESVSQETVEPQEKPKRPARKRKE